MANIIDGGYSTWKKSETINTSRGISPNNIIIPPPIIQNRLCFSVSLRAIFALLAIAIRISPDMQTITLRVIDI